MSVGLTEAQVREFVQDELDAQGRDAAAEALRILRQNGLITITGEASA